MKGRRLIVVVFRLVIWVTTFIILIFPIHVHSSFDVVVGGSEVVLSLEELMRELKRCRRFDLQCLPVLM
jgi:hypothetical protein